VGGRRSEGVGEADLAFQGERVAAVAAVVVAGGVEGFDDEEAAAGFGIVVRETGGVRPVETLRLVDNVGDDAVREDAEVDFEDL